MVASKAYAALRGSKLHLQRRRGRDSASSFPSRYLKGVPTRFWRPTRPGNEPQPERRLSKFLRPTAFKRSSSISRSGPGAVLLSAAGRIHVRSGHGKDHRFGRGQQKGSRRRRRHSSADARSICHVQGRIREELAQAPGRFEHRSREARSRKSRRRRSADKKSEPPPRRRRRYLPAKRRQSRTQRCRPRAA